MDPLDGLLLLGLLGALCVLMPWLLVAIVPPLTLWAARGVRGTLRGKS